MEIDKKLRLLAKSTTEEELKEKTVYQLLEYLRISHIIAILDELKINSIKNLSRDQESKLKSEIIFDINYYYRG